MSSEELRNEELEALQAIYSEELSFSNDSVSVKLSSSNDTKQNFVATLQFDLPQGLYPLEEGPRNISISAPWMSVEEKKSILDFLNSQIKENVGQSMIYTLVESVRSKFESLIDNELESGNANSLNESLSQNNGFDSEKLEFISEIFHGELIQDRKSTFQGHLAKIECVQDVKKALEKIKKIKKISLATHNMWAYRIVDNQTNIIREDCNDDGECHAGSRLLHLLNIVDAKSVLVVVSRWYGGIQLGPDRFKHINNAARDVLASNGYIHK